MIYLDTLTREDMPKIVEWRNKNPEGARTPHLLNLDMQLKFYDEEICNRDSKHRYWAVREKQADFVPADGGGDELYWDETVLIGLSGITNIEWENSRGEIALLIDPEQRGNGYGRQSLFRTITEGFNNLGLEDIYGKVYECNQSLGFWQAMQTDKWEIWYEPRAKRWNGDKHPAWCFNIRRES